MIRAHQLAVSPHPTLDYDPKTTLRETQPNGAALVLALCRERRAVGRVAPTVYYGSGIQRVDKASGLRRRVSRAATFPLYTAPHRYRQDRSFRWHLPAQADAPHYSRRYTPASVHGASCAPSPMLFYGS